MIPLALTPLLLLLLPLAQLAAAVGPPTQAMNLPTQARFNCPWFPAPHWVSPVNYPRLYRFCISFDADCDCRLDPRLPGQNIYRPVCNIEHQADPHDQQLQSAIHVCETTCSCYGGSPRNWETWPIGPPAIGPMVPPDVYAEGAMGHH